MADPGRSRRLYAQQAMAEATFQHLRPCLEQDVLVLTLTMPELSTDDDTEALRHELVRAASDSSSRLAVLDFHSVTFIASPGIRALLGFRRHFIEHGGRLVLCRLGEPIRDVLNTARLIGAAGSSPPVLFETAPDLATGIAYLKAPKTNQES